ncbi:MULTISPECIES: hypothetical protein [Rodentibacter]|uniref:hypothetical protein n=1 Tax=Rodentibacter TaxID=1960084 RepID=UPI001CFCF3C5|nr:hypothetical protein [Rodentibacter sp. JRC1]GJI55460.1 hypothetical protein HEMROJRC1_05720 [Rodentibacter sp. JRC1]
MVHFGEAERIIKRYFSLGQDVSFLGQPFVVEKVGKPTCNKGEPKTDIYLLLRNETQSQEIKISYKKDNADFLENKIKDERAEQIFGCDWQKIIEQSTQQIKTNFLTRPLIFKEGFSRTEKGAITLGWKFELMNKISGELSGRILLNKSQLVDVYAGTHLPMDKQHATVNNEVISYSGVANYILIGQSFLSAQDVLDNIIAIPDYVEKYPDIYFACKALNYRTFKQKFDGNRPLAVQINWQVIENKLIPEFIFNLPLKWNGNDVAEQLKMCLEKLNINTTDDINEQNAQLDYIYQ